MTSPYPNHVLVLIEVDNSVANLVKQEIDWCNKNKGLSEKGDMFEEGFVAGLEQALFLIEKSKEIADEYESF